MLKKNLIKLLGVTSLLGFASALFADLDYTCPEVSEIQEIVNGAIQENKTDIAITTRFGILQTKLNSTEIELNNLQFDYASLLYNKGNSAPYEIACSYKNPNITFYMYSQNPSDPMLYIGLSPFWIPQNSSYATCTYSAKYCIFKRKD